MNLIEFSEILKNPNQISKENNDSIENIIKEFPYFQAAHVIYLSSLKKQQSFKYNNSLKKTAAYTTDRSILFDFITTEEFEIVNFISKDNEIIKEIEIVDSEIVNPKITKEVENKTEITKNQTLPIGQPLQFNTNDTFSFNEWLNLTSITPIKRDSTEDQKQEVKEIKSEKDNNLIESFIASNPKIKPTKSNEASNFAYESILENDSLMTETLAHVYLEQKKYEKAITAFNILSLKYPEKSSFFANQIIEIKNLQQNKS